jgi:glycosyltransferase involved in cell wall biosynthesis
MKVLLLCNKSPFPPKEGGPMAMHAILTGLLDAGHQVKVLTFSTNKFPASEVPEILKKDFETVAINLKINPFKAFFNLFSNKSLHIVRFIKKEMTQKLVALLSAETFDIVQLESVFMTSYIDVIRQNSNAKIILRAHNVESLIWNRMTLQHKNPIKKCYIRMLWKRLRRYETNVLSRVDGIVPISKVDLEYFADIGCRTPMISIPFTINTEKFRDATYGAPEPVSFFHIGSMDWMPNQEGIRWFLEFVWHKIHRQNPHATFYLAGRNMPEWLKRLQQPGVVVVGEVEDAHEFIRSKTVLVVPLLSGSGIRIKIIEGMACMRAVLTTSIGAEGIEYADEENIMIADTPESFIEKAQKLIINPALCEKIGKTAHHLIMNNYDTEKIIADLTNFYQACITKQRNK